jgi:MFS family permease
VILRPHFTLFLSEGVAPGAPLWLLGAVFVIPSAVAVVLVPLGGRVLASTRRAGWLVAALLAMAVTALGQLGATTLALLVVARAVYGAASYLVDIAIDHAALGAHDDTYAHFGVVGAVQNAAIVVAPLAAALLADHAGWTALFAAAAALAVAAAALVPRSPDA